MIYDTASFLDITGWNYFKNGLSSCQSFSTKNESAL